MQDDCVKMNSELFKMHIIQKVELINVLDHMEPSSQDSLTPKGPSPSPSIPISLESLLPSEFEDDDKPPNIDNTTEFTRSTAWYIRNYQRLNPRSYSGHFETGMFNLYESQYNEGTKFVRPFLPQELRYLVENMRVVLMSSFDKFPRCLHFPMQENEFKIIMTIFSNLNANHNFSKNNITFAARCAARALPGRISFDTARMLKEISENQFKYIQDNVGIFSVPTDSVIEHEQSMTIRIIPKSNNNPIESVALNNRIIALGSEKALRVIDTSKKKSIQFPIEKSTNICPVPNGNFVCSSDRSIFEITINSNNDFDVKLKKITQIPHRVNELKVSSGGERTYAASNFSNSCIFSGLNEQFYQINSDIPFSDFIVNNDDVYVLAKNKVEYFDRGNKFAQWSAQKDINSITIDTATLLLGCCTDNECYIVDARTPYLNGLCIPTQNTPLVSFQMSPFMDIGVITTKNGIISIDIRSPEKPFSHISLQSLSSNSSPLKGCWIPESRLFSICYNNSFSITCPYLQMPILESYQLPPNDVISLHSNLQLNVINQEHSITFIGGHGYKFYVPSVL